MTIRDLLAFCKERGLDPLDNEDDAKGVLEFFARGLGGEGETWEKNR